MSGPDQTASGVRAALTEALARIAALRDAESSIKTSGPGTINPLDLTALDPILHGVLPQTPARTSAEPTSQPESPTSRPDPVEGPSTGSGNVSTPRPELVEGQPAPAPTEPAEEEKPEPPPKTLAELMAELDALTGLAEVKAEIHRQVAVLRVEGLRQKAGLRSPTITRHLVFVGNPGTGKTTVARLVGGIYRALGLLSKGQLVEVDRSELVAGYLGQTAMKTAEVVASAAGGVLFIDEAYSLSGDQYGQESVDTLVKEMEDRRDDLVLIVAGYPDPMVAFIAQNPGLASRFRTTIEFADYTDDELVEIFSGMASAADYDLTEGCLTRYSSILATTPRGPVFGNGRFARNLLEAAIGRHAWRLRDVAEPTVAQLRELLADDLDDSPAAGVDDESTASTTDEPVPDQPLSDEPAADQPVTNEPAADQPVTNEPAADQPVTDPPVLDEPAADQPVTNEPGAETAAPPTDVANDAPNDVANNEASEEAAHEQQ